MSSLHRSALMQEIEAEARQGLAAEEKPTETVKDSQARATRLVAEDRRVWASRRKADREVHRSLWLAHYAKLASTHRALAEEFEAKAEALANA